MITLTARLRQQYPKRYSRKDARTLIMRLVYGPMSEGIRNPMTSITRDQWDADHNVIRNHMRLTVWPADVQEAIYAAHERLKPKGVAIQLKEAA